MSDYWLFQSQGIFQVGWCLKRSQKCTECNSYLFGACTLRCAAPTEILPTMNDDPSKHLNFYFPIVVQVRTFIQTHPRSHKCWTHTPSRASSAQCDRSAGGILVSCSALQHIWAAEICRENLAIAKRRVSESVALFCLQTPLHILILAPCLLSASCQVHCFQEYMLYGKKWLVRYFFEELECELAIFFLCV